MAGLGASAAPALLPDNPGKSSDLADDPVDDEPGISGDSPYYTDLPPLKTPGEGTGATPAGGGEAGIPATVLDAYKKAATELNSSQPGCNLPWQLLAAIGKVESGHARGGNVDARGTTKSPILGPVLNGSGFANITDTDNGAYDGDKTHDRAVGPMQFIPGTWNRWGQDANDDGKRDPNNVYDASLAAAKYLCAGDRDLSNDADLRRAILGYNNSDAYVRTVLSWLKFYREGGAHEVPDGKGPLPGHRSDEPSGDGSSKSPSPGPSGSETPGSGGSKPGGGGDSSPPGNGGGGSTPPGNGSETPTTPEARVDHLDNATSGKLATPARTTFPVRAKVKAETSGGSAIKGATVTFTIRGTTDARFSDGTTSATVDTTSSGTATAPALKAGSDEGAFTVRAKVNGRTVSKDLAATVTAAEADKLARVGDDALTAKPGGEFAADVTAKATYNGAEATGVAATATFVKSADNADANDKGPYFKGADGKPLRKLALKTDADGLLKLPKVYADDTTGTFLLRITTTGGAVLTLEFKVA
ncbi:lytic transglycosylase domain-containing protein [Streptomyces boninensis]|uniref:lytic transglycosylase domain-containing protein n=1 Tax=Streptomyces boninensis TaxID=2039455 RepID=UPI003B21EC2D